MHERVDQMEPTVSMDVYEYTNSVTPTIRIDEIDQMAPWNVLDPLPTKVDGGRERAKTSGLYERAVTI